MLLAVDVGNTQTVLGLFEGERLAEHWRVATESERTGDELAALLADLLALRNLGFGDVSGICLSSTVPSLGRGYQALAERHLEAPLLGPAPGTQPAIPALHAD